MKIGTFPKMTRYMAANDYFNQKPKIDQQDEMFNMETLPVDNEGGLVVEKEGNGLTPNLDMLERVEDNIRDRFGLQQPSDFAEGDEDII